MTKTKTERFLLNPSREGHFCDECHVALATSMCIDARQVTAGILTTPEDGSYVLPAPTPLEIAITEPVPLVWQPSAPRYGCDRHPVFATLYWADGKSMEARLYNAN
jgi:hypothetical protein